MATQSLLTGYYHSLYHEATRQQPTNGNHTSTKRKMVATVMSSIYTCPDIATTYPHYTVIGTQMSVCTIPFSESHFQFFPFTETAVRFDASLPEKSSSNWRRLNSSWSTFVHSLVLGRSEIFSDHAFFNQVHKFSPHLGFNFGVHPFLQRDYCT